MCVCVYCVCVSVITSFLKSSFCASSSSSLKPELMTLSWTAFSSYNGCFSHVFGLVMGFAYSTVLAMALPGFSTYRLKVKFLCPTSRAFFLLDPSLSLLPIPATLECGGGRGKEEGKKGREGEEGG